MKSQKTNCPNCKKDKVYKTDMTLDADKNYASCRCGWKGFEKDLVQNVKDSK